MRRPRARTSLPPLATLLTAVLLVGCTTRFDQTIEREDHPDVRPDLRIEPAERGLTDAQRARNLASFDDAWEIVRDNHYDPDLNGIDWDAVRDELRPRVESATTMAEARSATQEMLTRLGESHYGLIPGDVYDGLPAPGETTDTGEVIDVGETDTGTGVAPFKVALVGGRALVGRVTGDVPDPRIEPGTEIVSIGEGEDRIDVAERARMLQDELAGRAGADFAASSALASRLAGPRGQAVRVGFETFDGERFDADVVRQRPPGEEVQFGTLPPFALELDRQLVETVAGPVIVARIGVFVAPPKVIAFMNDAVREANDAGAVGFVLDLRGNPGGFAGLGTGVAGYFVDEPDQVLGTQTMRDSSFTFRVNPRRPNFDGPLAVLIDGGSMSTSEIVAQGLSDIGRARLFGATTAGAALPSMIVELPNGDRLQYAIADYVSSGGKRLEGQGVEPDARVSLDRASLAEGRDPVLDAATDWIVTEAREQRDAAPQNRKAA